MTSKADALRAAWEALRHSTDVNEASAALKAVQAGEAEYGVREDLWGHADWEVD